MATEIGYSVPEGSLDFWKKRFEAHHVIYNNPSGKFGERYMTFLDPDGLKLELIETSGDDRSGWQTGEITGDVALKGFHTVTLTLNETGQVGRLLEEGLGYRLAGKEVNRYRWVNDSVPGARYVDVVELPAEKRGHVANGTVHHVAFRVRDDQEQSALRSRLLEMGFEITNPIDRNYFHSLYFRGPGGILFEIATDNPGFTVDEPLETLGTGLMLPLQYEGLREQIEARLPSLT